MLVRDKQYRAASLAAENHLRKHPADVSLRFVAGTLHASLGDAVSARRDFEEVIAREPSNAEAHYALAVSLRDDKGDLVAADEHFRHYLKLSPDGAHAEEARGLLLSSVR
jgi:Flp pilus assembly protein TadD